ARHTRHSGRWGPGLTGRAGRFWSVVSAAGAALVVWAGARSGDGQSRPDPPSAHAPGGGSARSGGAGHHPARALGSLVGWHRRRWPHAPHRLGRHPVSLAQGALPGHDAGAHRAAPAGLPGWSTLVAGRGPWLSDRQHKQGRKTKLPSAVAQRYAQTWVLFTAASTVAQAVAEYAGRMSIEETYRDWHHHWAVRAAVVDLPTAAMVARLIGIVCLAYTVQMHLGQRVSADPVGQRRRAQWTVTDRVSWFWCGQRLFDDPGYDWTDWLDQQWESLGWPVVTVPAMAAPEPTLAEAA